MTAEGDITATITVSPIVLAVILVQIARRDL